MNVWYETMVNYQWTISYLCTIGNRWCFLVFTVVANYRDVDLLKLVECGYTTELLK